MRSNSVLTNNSVTIEYSVDENSGTNSYLDSSVDQTNPITDTIEFTDPSGTGIWTAPLTIDLRNADNLDADHGSVTVTLNPPEDTDPYQVNDARDDATVTIYDNNTPKLSITNADQVFSGVTAMFTIISDIEPWQNLDIKFTPTESVGNFLDTTNNPSADAEWTASGQEFKTTSPYTTTLECPNRRRSSCWCYIW